MFPFLGVHNIHTEKCTHHMCTAPQVFKNWTHLCNQWADEETEHFQHSRHLSSPFTVTTLPRLLSWLLSWAPPAWDWLCLLLNFTYGLIQNHSFFPSFTPHSVCKIYPRNYWSALTLYGFLCLHIYAWPSRLLLMDFWPWFGAIMTRSDVSILLHVVWWMYGFPWWLRR